MLSPFPPLISPPLSDRFLCSSWSPSRSRCPVDRRPDRCVSPSQIPTVTLRSGVSNGSKEDLPLNVDLSGIPPSVGLSDVPPVPPSAYHLSQVVLGILDSSNPYFIHPSEPWGQCLVSSVLTEFIYSEWVMAMTMVLDGKNKIGFVDGTIPTLAPGHPLYSFWLRNNKLILSWILRPVSPNISKSLLYSKTTLDAWKVLHSRFSQGDVFKIADIQERIFALRQGVRSITEFFTDLVTLYAELHSFHPLPDCLCAPVCSCSLSKIRLYHNQDCVISFLRGLNESYDGAHS
ncbi:hypothetical protein LINGRAHAP2_LOCUS31052 [Linum grandiflorum]